MAVTVCTIHPVNEAFKNKHPRIQLWSLRTSAITSSYRYSGDLCSLSTKYYVASGARKERQRVCRSYFSSEESNPLRQLREGFVTLRIPLPSKANQKLFLFSKTVSSRLLSKLYAMPDDYSGDEEGESSYSPDAGWYFKDEYGPYPWDPAWQSLEDSSFEWVHEDIITFFTVDGVVRIGGTKLPRPIMRKQRGAIKMLGRQRRFKEEDYMDPKQGLCLGAIFDIAATNGLDMHRRFCVFGFCRSVEMLKDVVEDTVLEQGGEVVVAEKRSVGGLNEKLRMRVAMPLLWGIPPAVDSLNCAIRSGGGIVEKAYRQWEFL